MKKIYNYMLTITTAINISIILLVILCYFTLAIYSIFNTEIAFALLLTALVIMMLIPIEVTTLTQLITSLIHLNGAKKGKGNRGLAAVSCVAQIMSSTLVVAYVVANMATTEIVKDFLYYTIFGGLLIFSIIGIIYQVVNIIFIACDK